jgi:hypothetical protein
MQTTGVKAVIVREINRSIRPGGFNHSAGEMVQLPFFGAPVTLFLFFAPNNQFYYYDFFSSG